MEIPFSAIKQLHETTGAGYLDAKRALEAAAGDADKAIAALRKKGVSIAAKKAARLAREGIVECYLHAGDRIGVMLEIHCESEAAAETEIFRTLAHNIAMHIAAMNPHCVSREKLPLETILQERHIYETQARQENKTEAEVQKIAAEKMEAFYQTCCLLEQPYIRDPKQSVQDVIIACIAALRENITVRRFMRYEVGE